MDVTDDCDRGGEVVDVMLLDENVFEFMAD